jgi:hypothetical protein
MAGTFRFSHSKFGFAMSLILAGVGAYLMWMHTGHVLAAVPYVVLLACPLMQFFGNGHTHNDTETHLGRPDR